MAIKDPRRARRDWYSVSVDTVRGLAILLLIAGLLGGGLLAWRHLEQREAERETARLLNEGELLLKQAREQPGLATFRNEIQEAAESLATARTAYEQRDLEAARGSARRGCDLLRSLLDGSGLGKNGDQARFVTIQGDVQFRRGETGEWQEANSRSTLRAGDYVRTAGNGSAEIRWSDGLLFTVRANTQFIVSPGTSTQTDQTIQMDYGWVDLSTQNRERQIRTPGAVARVRQSSEAAISYDRSTQSGRFVAVRGSLSLAAKNGETQEVRELEQVIQKGDTLSQPTPLPGRPSLLMPRNDVSFDLRRQKTAILTWSPVDGASRYNLQLSRNRLFAGDPLIDDEDRAAPRATLGLRAPGVFYWRVAAAGRDGAPGPWSEAFRFVVAEGGAK